MPYLFELTSWASADFFSGRAKIFRGGGARTSLLCKSNEKDTFFPKKSKKILFLPGQGGKSPLPLPSPADTHA